jgi:hypothetical protein
MVSYRFKHGTVVVQNPIYEDAGTRGKTLQILITSAEATLSDASIPRLRLGLGMTGDGCGFLPFNR